MTDRYALFMWGQASPGGARHVEAIVVVTIFYLSLMR